MPHYSFLIPRFFSLCSSVWLQLLFQSLLWVMCVSSRCNTFRAKFFVMLCCYYHFYLCKNAHVDVYMKLLLWNKLTNTRVIYIFVCISNSGIIRDLCVSFRFGKDKMETSQFCIKALSNWIQTWVSSLMKAQYFNIVSFNLETSPCQGQCGEGLVCLKRYVCGCSTVDKQCYSNCTGNGEFSFERLWTFYMLIPPPSLFFFFSLLLSSTSHFNSFLFFLFCINLNLNELAQGRFNYSVGMRYPRKSVWRIKCQVMNSFFYSNPWSYVW